MSELVLGRQNYGTSRNKTSEESLAQMGTVIESLGNPGPKEGPDDSAKTFRPFYTYASGDGSYRFFSPPTNESDFRDLGNYTEYFFPGSTTQEPGGDPVDNDPDNPCCDDGGGTDPGGGGDEIQTFSGGCGITVTGTAIETGGGTNYEIALTDCDWGVTLGDCALYWDGDDINFNPSAIVGDGLEASGCEISVKAGCGISVDSSGVSIDNTTGADGIAGDGLEAGPDCKLKVKGSCAIVVDASGVNVDADTMAGSGLTGSGCVLDVGAGTGITVGANAVNAVPYTEGTGISIAGFVISCTLTTQVLAEGCGISIAADVISVDPTDMDGVGLVANTTDDACELDIDYGCGLKIGDVAGGPNEGKLVVDPSDLAGDYLDPGTGEDCGLDVVAEDLAKVITDITGITLALDGLSDQLTVEISYTYVTDVKVLDNGTAGSSSKSSSEDTTDC